MSRRCFTAVALVASTALAPGPAWASPDLELGTALELENIEDFVLDDLLERAVVAASRYEQRSSDSPVLVSTVTAREIEHLGHRTLAESLRSLTGVYASNDRAYSYVGVRGFSVPGDYNTRVHLSIAGHNLADPIYGQAPLGSESGLPVEAIARVELVRGATFSVYGAGALLGVIHVVPHSGASRPGLRLAATTRLRAETYGDRSGRSAVGYHGEELTGTYGHHGEDLDVFAATSVNLSPGLDRIYFPELDGLADETCTDQSLMPRPCDGIVRGADDKVTASGYAIVRSAHWTVQALAAHRNKRTPTGSFGTTVGDPEAASTDQRAFVDATYTRRRGALTFTARAAADTYRYVGWYPYVTEGERVVSVDHAVAAWLSGEGRVHWHLDRLGDQLSDLDVIGGAEITAVPYGHQDYRAAAGAPFDLDRNDQALQVGVYGEASARIGERVVVTSGARVAHQLQGFGLTANPRAAVLLDGRALGRLRASVGTAFRAPSMYERFYWQAQAGMELRAEHSRSAEVSAERYLSDRIRLQVTGFQQQFRDLITLQALPATEASDADSLLYFANVDAATGHGLEVEVEGQWDAVSARANYAWQRTRDDDGDLLSNSPTSLFGASALVPLAGGRATLGAEITYVGRRLSGVGGSVPPWFLTNATLTVPRLRGALGGAIGVTNLFDQATASPGGDDQRVGAIPGDPRTVWLRLGVGL